MAKPDLAQLADQCRIAGDKLTKAKTDMIAAHVEVDKCQRDYDAAKSLLEAAVIEATKGTR